MVNSKCSSCGKIGHYAKVCQQKIVSNINTDNNDSSEEEPPDTEAFQLNIWKINVNNSPDPKFSSNIENDFMRYVTINNHVTKVLIDTGAKVSVCGKKQAKSWGLLEKLQPSTAKIHPYNSPPISAYGTALCCATYKDRSVPVLFHILTGSCQPILEGTKATQLKIIVIDADDKVFNPVNLSHDQQDQDYGKLNSDICSVIQNYPHNFKGLGKMKEYQVKLYTDNSIKPVAVPPRPIPYHLKARVSDVLEKMIQEGVIEEHPPDEPAPWISCAVIVPKSDGSLRITLDARNLNKALISSNYPIPRQEDIKTCLSGAQYFSKLDFKSAFWQLELDPNSRNLTTFHANDKLYRYTRLIMGVKPAQAELNAALKPIFSHIPNVHLIHDDLIIATKTSSEHIAAVIELMKVIDKNNLTLNPVFLEKKKLISGV